MHELTELVAKVPKSKGEPYPPPSAQIFRWAGQIREFTSAVLDPRAVPEDLARKLDTAVASAGEEAERSMNRDGSRPVQPSATSIRKLRRPATMPRSRSSASTASSSSTTPSYPSTP